MIKINLEGRKLILAALGIWLPSLPHLCHRWWDKDLQPGQVWGEHVSIEPLEETGRLGCQSNGVRSRQGWHLLQDRRETEALRRVEEQESHAKVKPSRRWILSGWVPSATRGLCQRGRASPIGQSGSEAPHQEGSVTKGSSFMEWPWQSHPGLWHQVGEVSFDLSARSCSSSPSPWRSQVYPQSAF